MVGEGGLVEEDCVGVCGLLEGGEGVGCKRGGGGDEDILGASEVASLFVFSTIDILSSMMYANHQNNPTCFANAVKEKNNCTLSARGKEHAS